MVFEGKKLDNLTVLKLDHKLWFIAEEVTKMLGFSDSEGVLKRYVKLVDKRDMVFKEDLDKANKVIITENGLCSIIFSSKRIGVKKIEQRIRSSAKS